MATRKPNTAGQPPRPKRRRVPKPDRRQHPRVTINLETSVQLAGEPKHLPVLDISYGGICFLTNESMEAGRRYTVHFGSVEIHVKVLQCRMVELDSSLMTCAYKVRAAFLEEEEFATRILVDAILET